MVTLAGDISETYRGHIADILLLRFRVGTICIIYLKYRASFVLCEISQYQLPQLVP